MTGLRSPRTCSGVSIHSPYSIFGLWRNPFGELAPGERSTLAVVDTEFMLKHLSTSRHAIQFLGGCGFGKTTHLLALQEQLQGSQLVYFPEDGPRPALPTLRPLLVDEAQRMGWRRERQMLGSSGPLAIGTHRDMSRVLGRAGFQVMTIDVQLPKTPQVLAEILNKRIDASRVRQATSEPSVGVQCRIDLGYAERLLERFGSNVRRVENFLYDELQLSVMEKRPWPRAR